MKALNLKGQKFNRLTVLERFGRKGEKVMWKCRCDCGNITYVATCNLRCGKIQSCGCQKLEKLIQRSTKHNQRHTRLYEIWKSMKNRCFNPNFKQYKDYGGRGITVCDEWKNDFMPFYNWAMQNGYGKSLSIDRIDNNGNYEPSNCRWVDKITQANNTRNNRYITFNNKTLTLAQWSKEIGLSYSCLKARLNKGWSIEKSLTTPVKR